jgi:hypothetical protein
MYVRSRHDIAGSDDTPLRFTLVAKSREISALNKEELDLPYCYHLLTLALLLPKYNNIVLM